MEKQTQSNWCWAATSNSVSHFYSSLLNPWSQCKIAGAELSQTCCTSPVPSPCNVPWYLDKALSRTENYVSIQSGTISWQDVKAEIEKGLVVGTRIGWSGGGGHFMVIYGVSKILNTHYLHIDDPIYGKSILTVNQFATNYQGSGTWTHTYFTKKHYYFMWLKDITFKPELLKPIPEARPLLKFHNPAINVEKTASTLDLKLPHYSYVVKLSDIGKELKLEKTPNALRVVEFEQEQPLALYDLSTDSAQPELIQISTDLDYLQKLDNALEKIKAFAKEKKLQGELKHIKIPALNIEALALSTDGRKSDVYYLIRHFEQSSELLDEKTFTELLARQKTKLAKQDELMGA
jgi:hypothetical protein